ncbi:MAG: EAL domain-containing protein [Clostridiales bacterium]|nr:EAL domain-containing protein [Clostridiales bacterium]
MALLKGKFFYKEKSEQIEKEFNLLKENLYYSQHLAQIGSWTHDIVRDEIFLSDEIYDILDCSREDFDGELKKYYSFIHPDDLNEVKDATHGALTGKEYDIEYRIITKKGKVKYVHEKTKALYDEEQQPVKMTGILTDITNFKLVEKNLEELGQNYIQAQQIAGVGSWKYNVLTNQLFWSEELFNIHGIKSFSDFEKDLNAYLNTYVHSEDKENVENSIRKCLEGKPYEIEYRIYQNNGMLRYLLGKGKPIFNDQNQITGILGTVQDITEKKKLQEKIDKIQKRFEVLVQEASDVFEIISSDGTIQYISEASERVIGYKPEERIGKKIFDFYQGEQRQKATEMFNRALNNPEEKILEDLVFNKKNGGSIYLSVYMQNLIHDPVIEGIVVNIRDISKRVKMEQRLAYLSTHDEMTGLPNNMCFIEELTLQCNKAKDSYTKFALFMLDIDGLKNVNYNLGYDLGNELIIEIANRLKSYRKMDLFISRYFEDHFAIILRNDKTKKEYEAIAKDIIDILTRPYKMKNYEVDISVNIGICIYPEGGRDAETLQKHAKVTLLRAKKEGKNTYKVYSSDLDIQNFKDFTLRNDLRYAIEKNQLRVYYQPIIALKTNEILAAEALIRWEHPDWGLVPSDEFIAIAEETGLIIDIGKWVLRIACEDYKEWINNGYPDIKLSVNFSAIQFMENDFVKGIKGIIDELQLNGDFLVIEITESVLIKNSDHVISSIKNLQSMGMQVAIDDFGAGFSSLQYLSDFPADIIKLDCSFLKKIPHDERSMAIARVVANLSKELNIKLVAEGIENEGQLLFLKKNSYYAGQGFIYSPAIPKEEFVKILAKRKCKPIIAQETFDEIREERRKYFRVKFRQLLECDLTISEIKGKKINVGNTKALVKNISSGGLCFIGNVRFPVGKEMLLQFSTKLLGNEIKVMGYPVWIKSTEQDLHEYGVEFLINDSDRADLTQIINEMEILLNKNVIYFDGSFIENSAVEYFEEIIRTNKTI